jgi:hypothetical protein
MPFQSTVNVAMDFGIPGELLTNRPWAAQSLILDSADAAYNVIGARAFTTKSEGVGQAGGDLNVYPFAGILANPKVYPSLGTALTATLAPTLVLPNKINAEFVYMGQMIVTLPAAAAIGDKLLFDTTTGALSTEGAVARGTGVIATTTLTISGYVAGSGPFRVGSLVQGANVAPGTYITALGTGLGGDGTYTVNLSQTAASAAVTAQNVVPPAGKQFVPNCVISKYAVSGAGLGVIEMTNPTS